MASLAGRVLHPETTVRPRPLSVFEPIRHSKVAVDGQPAAAESSVDEWLAPSALPSHVAQPSGLPVRRLAPSPLEEEWQPGHAEPAPAQTASVRVPAPAQVPPGEQPAVATAPAVAVPRGRRQSTAVPGAASPSILPEHREPDRHLRTEIAEPSSGRPGRRLAPADVPSRRPSARAESGPDESARPAARAVPGRPARPLPTASAPGDADPVISPSERRRLPLPRSLPHAVPALPRRHAGPQQASDLAVNGRRAGQVPGPPPVQVTIGCIEVRAAREPVRVADHVKRPKVKSLEDYVRERRAETRR
jgi:hypothetical protein